MTARPRRLNPDQPTLSRREALAPVVRWTAYRKLQLIGAIRAGIVGRDEAMAAHAIEADELASWEYGLATLGPEALRARAAVAPRAGGAAVIVAVVRWADRRGDPCAYCGAPMIATQRRQPTRDHMTPKSRGGGEASHNSRIVCATCNEDKSDRTLWEWAEALRLAGDARAERVAADVAGAYGGAA